jgi:hypothetical protein
MARVVMAPDVMAADSTECDGTLTVLGKGGDASSRFSEVFAVLLPKAVMEIQK